MLVVRKPEHVKPFEGKIHWTHFTPSIKDVVEFKKEEAKR